MRELQVFLCPLYLILMMAAIGNAIEEPNQPPSLISLNSDANSPQVAGTIVTWTAQASDPENDPIFFRYLLNGTPVSDWQLRNGWDWTTNEVGASEIEVQVKDDKHLGPEGANGDWIAKFAIVSTTPKVSKTSNVISNLREPAVVQDEYSWEKAVEPINLISQSQNAPVNGEPFYNISEINESDPLAWFNRGNILFIQNKYNESLEAYDNAIKLNKSYTEAWYAKASALSSLYKRNETIEACDKVIELNPKSAPAWNLKGEGLSRLLEYDAALRCFENATQLEPNRSYYWENEAESADMLGKYDVAISALNHAEDLIGTNFTVFSTLTDYGNLHYMMAAQCERNATSYEYNASLLYYDAALKRDSQNADAWLGKGKVHNALGNQALLVKCFDNAIKFNCTNLADAWFYKGSTLAFVHKSLNSVDKDVRECYEKSIEIGVNASSNLDDMIAAGKSFRALKNYTSALRMYDRVLALDPNNARAWYNKGRALYDMNDYDGADAAYDNVSVFSADPVTAADVMVASFQESEGYTEKYYKDSETHNYEMASKYLDKVFRYFQNSSNLSQFEKYVLGSSHFMKGKVLERACLLSHDDPDNAEFHEILRQYDEAIAVGYNQSNIWKRKANVLYTMGKYHEAIAAYKMNAELQGIKIVPDTKYGGYKVTAPIGSYQASFSIRTLLYDMDVSGDYASYAAGSGTTYHIESFKTCKLDMEYNNQWIHITVAECINSPKPENPLSSEYCRYDSGKKLTIDGHQTTLWENKNGDAQAVVYQHDANTFVSVISSMDYDKDVSLMLETLHITKRTN